MPEKWEQSLARLLEEEDGVPAEDSWLGVANPLAPAVDVFAATPTARFQLLVALSERMLLDDVVTEGPANSPLAWTSWHGQPVNCEPVGGFRYWVVPGECRVWRETRKRDKKGEDDTPGTWETACAAARYSSGDWMMPFISSLLAEASLLCANSHAGSLSGSPFGKLSAFAT